VLVTKDKIAQTIKKIRDLQIVEKEFTSIEGRKKKLNEDLLKLLNFLENKNHEISKLERFSVGGLIKSVFIDKKKTLEQKRDEYYELSQQYEKLKSEISALNYEYDILERKYNDLLRYKQELEALIEKREKELFTEDSSEGLTYRNIIDDINEIETAKQKVLFSISIIDKIISKLTLLSAALREVEGYGHWKSRRRMRRTNSYKSVAIRNAKQYYLESDLMIKKLEKSLVNIDIENIEVNLKPIEFQGFVNVFFDNFITDIILKKKINDAVDNVEDVYQNLNILKNELNNKLIDLNKKIDRLQLVKKDVVIK
jgi:hypothetical protein